jgi:hypothetical protein
MSEYKKQLPPWLVGLILAVIVFAVVLVVLNALGYGDDPAVGLTPSGLSHTGGGIRFPLQSMPSAGR